MAIIGDGFVDYVKDQIDTRQKALGEYDNRNIKNTMAFMTRTPWVRMVSSIDLEDKSYKFPGIPALEKLKSSGNYSGIDLSGDNLAKNFILFNGISNQQGGIDNLYSGITGGPLSGRFGGAYGFGSRDDIQNERGFVPMPGITNVNFQYRNDGALAMATVQIKAFSRSQFQLIDILFQRPGYTVLLEFGNTVYLDNKGNLKEADYNTEPFRYMFPETGITSDMFKLHEVIAKEKEKWGGNYEGFFAKIAKWNWKFNTDGSYDITINLVGMGDIIESLKINVAPNSKLQDITKLDKDAIKEAEEDNLIIISEAISSEFNYRLYQIYNQSKELAGKNDGSGKKRFVFFNPIINKYSFITNQSQKIIPKLSIQNGGYAINGTTNSSNGNYNPPIYITFGSLLALVTKYLSIKDKDSGISLINFNFNFENLNEDTNYMATFPGNFSSNPNVCLIPYQPVSPDITPIIQVPETGLNLIIKKGAKFNVDGNLLIGRIANVYLDINFIAKTFKGAINDKKEVILLDFLKNILNEMNNALGGINEFRIIHNKDTNLFEILSENPLNTKPNPEPHTINTFGVTKGEGSFVREMDLNSELTDKYAAMVTIGAQANGNIAQSNSTAFSIYNRGLVDRIIKEKVNINSNTTTEIPEDPFLNLFSKEVIKCFGDVYQELKFIDENISILQNINSEFCKLATGALTQRKKYPAPFFLPFNLSLTMDGLSGMKIYQSFKVDGKALPLTYNSENIQLIIKSLSHDISPNGWLTKIETIAGPIFEIDQNIKPGTYSESGQIETSATNPELANTSTPTNITPPPSNRNPLGRREAMLKAYNEFWGSTPEAESQCGAYTSRLAAGYKKYLTNKPTTISPPPPPSRDANGATIDGVLKKLGYRSIQISSPNGGNILTKNQVINTINSTTFEYGDVIRYWSIDGPPSENSRKYGHIQIYVGDINKSGWSSSFRENYGTSFVYRNKPGTQWILQIYKAPSTPN